MQSCPSCRATYSDDITECPEDGSALLPSEAFVAQDAPLAPGAMVGEYRVERMLGSGSFGDVYAGEQPLIGKKVAIKVLHQKYSSEPQVVSRFIAEARAVNRIRHRNIIDIFSFGLIDERRHYFVMELLDGLTLGELLEQKGRLGLRDALPIIRGIADALDAAHEAGVTHRDLKPDNIFLAQEKDGSYFPKLLDFGVAKLVTEDMAHRTATGVAIGTPRYMSPEQCRGKKIDHRADIYSLGVVIHEMLTGQPLFGGESAMDVMFKHTSEPPPAMSSVCPDLPKELDAPVLAMLAKRPNARPPSAGEAIALLIQEANKATSSATPQTSSNKNSNESSNENSNESSNEALPVTRDVAEDDKARLAVAATTVAKPSPLLVVEAAKTVPMAPTSVREVPSLPTTLEPEARAKKPWALIGLATAGVVLGAIALLRSSEKPLPATTESAPQTPSAAVSEAKPGALVPQSPPTPTTVVATAAPSASASSAPSANSPSANSPSANSSAPKPVPKPKPHKDIEVPYQ